jgi:hypothetical protein
MEPQWQLSFILAELFAYTYIAATNLSLYRREEIMIKRLQGLC